VFWLWQVKHGFTDRLEIIEEYPGTNSVDNQGPTPGTVPNSWLTLASPLDPFKRATNGTQRPYTSLDCINIEKQLGYTYGPGSLQAPTPPAVAAAAAPALGSKVVHVAGINRAPIRGSFLVSVFANHGGRKVLVGTEAVLSRWSVKYCANCQTHLEVKAAFNVPHAQENLLGAAAASAESYEVVLQTRDGEITADKPTSEKVGVAAFMAELPVIGRPKQTARVTVR
jgi:tyrosinase